jgi:hypothetical protein
MGRVWFTAHIVAVTFLLLYLLECAGRGRPLVAGAALAAAFLARTPAVFGLVFWVLLALRRAPHPRQMLVRGLQAALPLALAVALLLGQNAVRFGSPLDFGYLKMSVARQLEPDLRRYGQFNVWFIPRNLKALLVTPPLVTRVNVPVWWRLVGGPRGLLRQFTTPGASRSLPFPVQFDPWGTGLWAVSPALIFVLRPPGRRAAALYAAAWLSVLAIGVPNLLYYNTGWYQFGYRFSLDFVPFLLVLTAMGLRRPLQLRWYALFVLLLAISVASNFLGARWFLRLPPY